MNKPKTIKTNERIFKILSFDGETFLSNLEHIKLKDLEQIKKVSHLWDFKFQPFGKRQLKTMIESK